MNWLGDKLRQRQYWQNFDKEVTKDKAFQEQRNTFKAEQQKEKERTRARPRIEQAIASVSIEQLKTHYQNRVHQVAVAMDHQGRTKKEVLALAYQKIRNELTLKNPSFDDHIKKYSEDTKTASQDIKDNFYPDQGWLRAYVTQSDREAYLAQHKNALTVMIQELDHQAQKERLDLLHHQRTTENIKDRIDYLQSHQQARENKLDQQLEAVDAQIDKIQQALTRQKQTPKPENGVDIDRLENMIDELRRLKNGMAE